MSGYVVLSLVGRDQPGIVARISKVLFDTGCNIEDSSMTRLQGEFSIMLILKTPPALDLDELMERVREEADGMGLACQLRGLSSQEFKRGPVVGELFMVNVLGADKPGIVHRVADAIAQAGGNITDLRTQVVGKVGRPVYVMNIEVEGIDDEARLSLPLGEIARELAVEVVVRPLMADPL